MNRTITFSILITLLLITSALLNAGHSTLATRPPGMGEVQLIGDILVVSRGLPQLIAEPRTGTRQVGDKVETYTYNFMRTVTVPSEEAVAPENYRILDMEGKPVDRAVLVKRLKEMTPVLISDDTRKVPGQFLVIYKPDTLIIYLRPDRPKAPQFAPAEFNQPLAPPRAEGTSS